VTSTPLTGIELVLIDGNNVLHRRQQGLGDAALRGLLVELQRQLPASVRGVFFLDGHAAPGTPARQKVTGSLEIRHAGRPADDAIVAEVTAQPWAARGRTIVVTDDRALADRSRTAGALTRRLDWLAELSPAPQMQAPKAGSSIGAGRPSKPRRAPASRRR
jgi:hypothetical protein